MVRRGEWRSDGKEGTMVGEWKCEVVQLRELKVSKNDGTLDVLG
jgi:hypothetical protein